jgi:hypothetical protein
VGFTTGTGDGFLVVQRYMQLVPENNTLAPYMPGLRAILDELHADGSTQVGRAVIGCCVLHTGTAACLA